MDFHKNPNRKFNDKVRKGNSKERVFSAWSQKYRNNRTFTNEKLSLMSSPTGNTFRGNDDMLMTKTLNFFSRRENSYSEKEINTSNSKIIISNKMIKELSSKHNGAQIYKKKAKIWVNKKPIIFKKKDNGGFGTATDAKMAFVQFITKKINYVNPLLIEKKANTEKAHDSWINKIMHYAEQQPDEDYVENAPEVNIIVDQIPIKAENYERVIEAQQSVIKSNSPKKFKKKSSTVHHN